MKTIQLFASAIALAFCVASTNARSESSEKAQQIEAAVEAAAPDGVRILDVAVAGSEIRIIGTAKELKDMATMMRRMDESKAFDSPNLEFTSDFGDGSSSFYMTVSAI